jgi:putative ABC transport system substrate-binding protein
VASQPDVVLSSTTTTEALLQQTRTIPIIFGTVADPVGSGLVASLPLRCVSLLVALFGRKRLS